MQNFKVKQAVFVVLIKAKAVCIRFQSHKNVLDRAKEKKLFPSDRMSKKKYYTGGRKKKKKIFHIFFVTQFYYFTIFSIWILYTTFIYKWFISIETSSWYICSIFKTRDNFFQYILIRKFITIKDDWLNIDIVKILLLWNVLSA